MLTVDGTAMSQERINTAREKLKEEASVKDTTDCF